MSEAGVPPSRSADGAAGARSPLLGRENSAEEAPTAAAATLFSGVLRLVRDVLDLAAAEVRLAALSGVTIVVSMILAAVLLIMTWAFIASVLAYVLVMLGLPWPAAGLLMAALHAGAAYFLWRRIVGLSRSLTLPELRRSVLPQAE